MKTPPRDRKAIGQRAIAVEGTAGQPDKIVQQHRHHHYSPASSSGNKTSTMMTSQQPPPPPLKTTASRKVVAHKSRTTNLALSMKLANSAAVNVDVVSPPSSSTNYKKYQSSSSNTKMEEMTKLSKSIKRERGILVTHTCSLMQTSHMRN